MTAATSMDDGMRCLEWRSSLCNPDTMQWEGEWSLAALANEKGYWQAHSPGIPGDADAATGFASPRTLEAAKLAAETWLRKRHPFFDRDWPGRWGNPPTKEAP